MKKVFDEVLELDKADHCSDAEATLKLVEELGELVRAINKTNGRKLTDESQAEISNEIGEEIADTLQNLFNVANRFGFSYDDIIKFMEKKNQSWKNKIEIRNSKK